MASSALRAASDLWYTPKKLLPSHSQGNNSHIAQLAADEDREATAHIIEAKLKQIMRSMAAFRLSATA